MRDPIAMSALHDPGCRGDPVVGFNQPAFASRRETGRLGLGLSGIRQDLALDRPIGHQAALPLKSSRQLEDDCLFWLEPQVGGIARERFAVAGDGDAFTHLSLRAADLL